MRILQCGCAKSGNYWLYRILTEILNEAGVPKKSFIQNHPIFPIATEWHLSHPDQAGIDVIDIERGRVFYRIGPYFRHPVEDLDRYVQNNRLVWTHSRFIPDSATVYRKFDKIVYIVRDPRDVSISMAHFMFTSYKKNASFIDHHDPKSYLRKNFLKHITGWTQHVASHLMAQPLQNFHIVFYERLRQNFDEEMEELLEFLGVDLDYSKKRKIKEAVTVESMRQRSSEHVRSGSSGQWREVLTCRQQFLTKSVAGPLLRELNYPLRPAEEKIPNRPNACSYRMLRQSMRRAMIARAAYFIFSNIRHIQEPETA